MRKIISCFHPFQSLFQVFSFQSLIPPFFLHHSKHLIHSWLATVIEVHHLKLLLHHWSPFSLLFIGAWDRSILCMKSFVRLWSARRKSRMGLPFASFLERFCFFAAVVVPLWVLLTVSYITHYPIWNKYPCDLLPSFKDLITFNPFNLLLLFKTLIISNGKSCSYET